MYNDTPFHNHIDLSKIVNGCPEFHQPCQCRTTVDRRMNKEIATRLMFRHSRSIEDLKVEIFVQVHLCMVLQRPGALHCIALHCIALHCNEINNQESFNKSTRPLHSAEHTKAAFNPCGARVH
jgi:hypothetical protein